MQKEVTSTSETLVLTYKTALKHNSKDYNLRTHRLENFKFYNMECPFHFPLPGTVISQSDKR
jgi:hypothetical protein